MATATKQKVKPEIEEIVTLARQQTKLEKEIAKALEAIKKLNARYIAIQQEALPLAMAEAGLKKFTLDSGESIEIKEDFTVGIPAARRPEAFAWLEEQGYGGLIKTEVAVEFGKGELAKAQALAAKLLKEKYATTHISRDVHWQTLKAFINESVRETRPVPMDLFGAIPLNKAVIKAPKSKTERKKHG
jgi:hypothetical protein